MPSLVVQNGLVNKPFCLLPGVFRSVLKDNGNLLHSRCEVLTGGLLRSDLTLRLTRFSLRLPATAPQPESKHSQVNSCNALDPQNQNHPQRIIRADLHLPKAPPPPGTYQSNLSAADTGMPLMILTSLLKLNRLSQQINLQLVVKQVIHRRFIRQIFQGNWAVGQSSCQDRTTANSTPVEVRPGWTPLWKSSRR